jgi:hypothetical protein
MKKSITLTFLSALCSLFIISSLPALSQTQPDPVYLKPTFTKTSKMCSLIFTLDSRIPDGYELGVYSSLDSLIGSGVAFQGKCVFTAWGDNPQTEIVDGAKSNEELTIKAFDTTAKAFHAVELSNIWDGIGEKALDHLMYLDNQGWIKADVFIPFLPVDEEISAGARVYPDVTNGTFTVFSGVNCDFTIAVSDMLGNKVLTKEIAASASNSNHIIDLSPYANGLYIVAIETNKEEKCFKVILSK